MVMHHPPNIGVFFGPYTPSKPQKIYSLAQGLSPIYSKHWGGAQGLMWGAKGSFPPAAAMVVAVEMPVVFVLWQLKNTIKTLKLVV
jgi:hypothetical protein